METIKNYIRITIERLENHFQNTKHLQIEGLKTVSFNFEYMTVNVFLDKPNDNISEKVNQELRDMYIKTEEETKRQLENLKKELEELEKIH